jgi:hypothetical protein
MINLVYWGLAYATCANLNSLQLREVARTPGSQAMAAAASVECQWKSSILSKLACFSSDPSVAISYSYGEANINGKDVYVALTTSFTVRPLLNIPFFGKVPGLAAPMNISITGERLLENPRYATE